MKQTRLVFITTMLSTLGFFVALFINIPGQSPFELTLNNIAVIFLGVAAIVGWLWLCAKFENADLGKPYEDNK
ncbi:MAG: hypothetical protein HOA53_14835 [Anaerolineae bacterium]|jgi:hypothetical protein|nr:hypothetical protein [Anaerolineae bacterium]